MPAVLNDLERKILDYMVQYLRTNTYQPSIREIGEEFGIKSTKTVSEHLRALATKGYLERDPSRSRGVRILGVDLNPQTVSVPCFRSLPDRSTGLAAGGVEAYYSFDRRMAGAKGSYFVRVQNGDFTGLGIEPGDFILVEPAGSERLEDGDVAVVKVTDRPALYRFSRNGSAALLQSGNGEQPLTVEELTELEVTGRVVAVYRRFEESEVPLSPTAH